MGGEVNPTLNSNSVSILVALTATQLNIWGCISTIGARRDVLCLRLLFGCNLSDSDEPVRGLRHHMEGFILITSRVCSLLRDRASNGQFHWLGSCMLTSGNDRRFMQACSGVPVAWTLECRQITSAHSEKLVAPLRKAIVEYPTTFVAGFCVSNHRFYANNGKMSGWCGWRTILGMAQPRRLK